MDQDAVRTLARQIIVACAPDEIELFDADADAYFADPARARAGDPVRDKALAGGFAQEIPSLIPAALYLAEHVLAVTTDHAIEKTGEQLRDRWRQSKWSRKGRPAGPRRLATFEVRLGTDDDDGKAGIVAVIADQEFPVSAEQAARMLETLVAEIGHQSHPDGSRAGSE